MKTFKKVYGLLTENQRKHAILLLVLMVVGMALEMLGIGLVIPVIGMLIDESYLARLRDIDFITRYIDLNNHERVVYCAMLALLIAYVFKTVYLIYLNWRQVLFASDIQVSLSQRLLEIYMRQPYAFHLRRNSSELMRNVIGEVNLLGGAVSHLLQVAAEGLVFAGIFLLLLVVEPKGAVITIVVLGSIGWGLLRLTRTYSFQWGKARQFHDGLRVQYLQEGITGIKDVKVLGKEAFFLDKHQNHNMISARAGEIQSVFQQSPRLLLELLAVLGLVLLVISMISHGKSLHGIVPTLGLFAAATFRLVPSASRIVSSLHTLRFSLPVIDTIYEELQLQYSMDSSSNTSAPVALRIGVSLDQIVFKYEGVTRNALDAISIEIPRGQMVGIVGQSGSGKSTLVDIVLGLLRPESGRLLVDGKDVADNLFGWRASIGYVPQTIFLIDDTLRRNIALGVPDHLVDEKLVRTAVIGAQLDEYVSGLPEGLGTMVGERGVRLSGGQRQRIGIARALYRDPDLLVLDEATSALDMDTEDEIMQGIYAMQGDKTILIVAHRLSTVKNCNKIYRLDQGRVIESGTPNQVLRYSITS